MEEQCTINLYFFSAPIDAGLPSSYWSETARDHRSY
jgi:hypothetical protein